MEPKQLGTRLRAVRAALRETERLLMKHDEICLHVYGSLGVINVLHVDGRKRETVASFSWPVKEGA
jgi:hypothetical protein